MLMNLSLVLWMITTLNYAYGYFRLSMDNYQYHFDGSQTDTVVKNSTKKVGKNTSRLLQEVNMTFDLSTNGIKNDTENASSSSDFSVSFVTSDNNSTTVDYYTSTVDYNHSSTENSTIFFTTALNHESTTIHSPSRSSKLSPMAAAGIALLSGLIVISIIIIAFVIWHKKSEGPYELMPVTDIEQHI
nr:uncharacterized protein LOC122270238 [Parasteatoda tepidariorum]